MKTASAILFILIVSITESFAQNSALPPDSRQVKPPQVEQRAPQPQDIIRPVPPQQESRQPQRQPVQSSPSTAATPQVFDDNRLDVYLGAFIPKEEKMNTGFTIGAGYTHFLTENLGFGAFLDVIYTSGKFAYKYYSYDVEEYNFASILLGVQAVLQISIEQKNFVHASAKLGYGHARIWDGYFYANDMALIFEGGFRRKMSNLVDMGVILKYTAFKPTVDFYSLPVDVDLSGISLAFDIGFLF